MRNHARDLACLMVAAMIYGSITGCMKRIPAYDEANRPITEQEISRHKSKSNTLIYTLGGAGVSFGVSFFLGTIAHRSLADNKELGLWGTTAIGTVTGAAVFLNSGRRKDRQEAIEYIKDRRRAEGEAELQTEQKKQNQLDRELERLKQERDAQEAERKRLMEELKKKEKPTP